MSEDVEKAGTSTPEQQIDGVRARTSAAVTAVWCELFGVPQVEPGDDFFALGGHSMIAVRMASRLRTELGLRVPVRMVLENPTVDGLSQRLAEAVEADTGPDGR